MREPSQVGEVSGGAVRAFDRDGGRGRAESGVVVEGTACEKTSCAVEGAGYGEGCWGLRARRTDDGEGVCEEVLG